MKILKMKAMATHDGIIFRILCFSKYTLIGRYRPPSYGNRLQTLETDVYSPYLWRKRKFMFGGMLAEESAKKACAYLKIFGRHLRVLTVGFHAPTLRTVKIDISSCRNIFQTHDFPTRITSKRVYFISYKYGTLLAFFNFPKSVCRFLRRLRFLHTLNLVAARLRYQMDVECWNR
ncbi:hypothetical protein KUTeg_009667 [Tegillarca granosa]|uniref:Uncharacterized protein n=1 Tax=Tegillarca granosa TaxID=220873 RepID=A0ABQ9F4J0_TEGGR|nr:hypothetical protein KUTeg_009667 [Tegillarca granosa]